MRTDRMIPRPALSAVYAILCILFIVSGCTPADPSSTRVATGSPPTSAPTYPRTFLRATLTPTRKLIPSNTPAVTTPQNTKPFQTTSTLPPPTYTPLPTLNPTDAAKQIEQLFTANSSCRLPCYNGITPGKSKWPEVKSYLLSFADKYGWRLPYYGFGYNLPEELEGGQHQLNVTVTVRGLDEIKLIRTAWYGYSIHELLADYGRPTEIYIFVLPVPFSPPGIVELVFYYPEHGFMALFEGKIGNGKRLVICPDHQDVMGTRSVLWIWNPDETNSLQDLSRSEADLRDSWEYQPLQAATGMTVDEFYATYSDPVEFRKCFDMANPYQ